MPRNGSAVGSVNDCLWSPYLLFFLKTNKSKNIISLHFMTSGTKAILYIFVIHTNINVSPQLAELLGTFHRDKVLKRVVYVIVACFPFTDVISQNINCGRVPPYQNYMYYPSGWQMTQHYWCPSADTGRERLIRSHSAARFCFELSGNSN